MKNTLKDKLKEFIIYDVIKKGILRYLSDRQFIMIDYFAVYGKMPDLQHPKTFSEKLQWVKINGCLEKYTKYVDKYEVRDFISKTIGKEYLVPLIGAWDNFEDIPFNKLPRQFILKATHGSGYGFICKDKSSLNRNELEKIVAKWMRESFYKKTREVQYKDCKPRIICEKYLEDDSGGLIDYKILCFDGKPYMIEVLSDRFTGLKYDPMDLNWNELPISAKGFRKSDRKIKKPENLNKMLYVSEMLSQSMPFVRVDLYSVNNKIYFGELTFIPAGGFDIYEPPEVNYQLGELINLSRYTTNRLNLSSKKINSSH